MTSPSSHRPLVGTEFLATTAVDRFRQIAALVSETARPYTDFYPVSTGETTAG